MDSKNLAEQAVCLNGEKKVKVKDEKSFWSKITLEPMWFGVTLSMSMGLIAFKNLYLHRACTIDLGYSYENCTQNHGPLKDVIEKESQMVVTTLKIWSSFVGGFITCVILVFLGPWSDVSGRRKPLMILPVVGIISTTLGLLIVQAFPQVSTVWVVYIEAIPIAIGGQFSLLMMASFNYLGDICYATGKCPTVMMGSNSGFISLYAVIGSILGPLLYRTMGFVGVFSISLALELTSLLYIIFCVSDINISEKIPNILDWRLPLDAVKCVFKKRPGDSRKIIILMIIVPCCHTIMMIGDITITYMYVRQQFQWTEIEYSILLGLRSIIHVIGTFIIVTVFKKRFKMSDRNIGLIGGISQIVAAVAFMASFKPWMIYATSIFSIFIRGAIIAERPILNKQIQANEQGKVNCFTVVLEKFVSFLVSPFSNVLYLYTIHTFPTAFALIGLFAGVLQFVCYMCVNREYVETEMIVKEAEQLTI